MNTAAERHATKLETARRMVNVAVIRWSGEPEDQRLTARAIADLQAYLEVLQEVPAAPAPEPLPARAADVISRYFISPPEHVEIISSDYLGNYCWNVETKVTYADTGKTEPRPFLLALNAAGKLLVNP